MESPDLIIMLLILFSNIYDYYHILSLSLLSLLLTSLISILATNRFCGMGYDGPINGVTSGAL
jgi:hypothetical protein